MSMSEENSEKSPPHCDHFVIRKKRYCRMFVRPGEKYCGEHQPPVTTESLNSDGKIRIVCPLDPKHTCYAHNLNKHLKICNARPQTPLPYIKKDVNSGRNHNETIDDSYKLLSTFTVEEIIEVIAKVNKIYDDHINGGITEKFMSEEIIENEIKKPEYGDKSKKHLIQTSSILGLLNEYKLIKANSCFVEFGAGKGVLSYWLAQIPAIIDNSVFLLIERSSPKHKRDNKLDKSDDKVQRIRADIADLILDELKQIEQVEHIVGVTKHLCGEATDLALRCLINLQRFKDKLAGCVMTFCCHHRCRWVPYTGKQFFQENDLTRKDFDIMCGMSSWATCGTGFSRQRNAQTDEKLTYQNERDKEIGLNRFEKEEIGRRCKNILNSGRLQYLKQYNFNCYLHYYVKSEISLENVCIVAYK